jgi:hypothetical protein
MTSTETIKASTLAARAEREGVRAILGDLVSVITIVPGHAGLGTVTGIAPDGTLEVTDNARRAVAVPAAEVIIEESVMDVADDITPAQARRYARYLPAGVRARDAEFEDWATAIAVRNIAAVTL